jgi:hypothetical protein
MPIEALKGREKSRIFIGSTVVKQKLRQDGYGPCYVSTARDRWVAFAAVDPLSPYRDTVVDPQ